MNAWDALTVRGEFKTHPPVRVLSSNNLGEYSFGSIRNCNFILPQGGSNKGLEDVVSGLDISLKVPGVFPEEYHTVSIKAISSSNQIG